jgi:hypothetical protein
MVSEKVWVGVLVRGHGRKDQKKVDGAGGEKQSEMMHGFRRICQEGN